ncbi:hypothetical protein KJ996_03445 [Patescibacteria group bacterium]|nr:hypothetical protein [Patescibacteria group bacterium]
MKRFDFAAFPPVLFIGSIFFALLLAVTTNVLKNYYLPAELSFTETESGTLLTETGSIVLDERQLTFEERDARIKGFILRLENRFEKIQAQRDAQQLRRQESIQHQILCRDDVRRSNRDMKLPTLFRCYRGALTLDLEALRKERTNLDDLIGATLEAREASLATINALMDAIATIVDAIDDGVYGSQKDLEEAKHNLAERYWIPKWIASTKLRADEMLTWTSYFLETIAPQLIENGFNEEYAEVLTNAYACFEDAELRITAVIDAEDLDAITEKMDGALGELAACLGILRGELSSMQEPETVLEEEIQEENNIPANRTPRRVLRRARLTE